MTEEKIPKPEDPLPEIDLKPEDIYLEVDLRTLIRMDSNLAHSEDDMVDALSKVRWTRKWIHKIMKDDADRVMKSNEERIAALEENMKSSIEALEKVEQRLEQKQGREG